MKPMLRVYKNSSKYNYKYEVFTDNFLIPSFETNSKTELRIWLDLRGLKIGKRYRAYEKYFSNAIDYEVKGL